MQEHQHAVEAALAASGAKATYGGAVTVGLGWLLSSQFAVLVGAVIGVAGFAVQWYYRWRTDQREQAEHEQRMKALTKGRKP